MAQDERLLPPVVIKKYANRRLYDTESSIYITLDTLADMVRHGRDFVVYDAKTGDDITRAVLTQIIMEEEIRGRNMLPTAFLRQLISFYGDSVQGLVPDYLERMMEQFALHQIQARASMQRAIQTFSPTDVARMDCVATGLSSYYRPANEARLERAGEVVVDTHRENEEVVRLREEVARLQLELARLAAGLTEPGLAAPVGPETAIGGIRH